MQTLTLIARVLRLLDALNETRSFYGIENQNNLLYVKLLDPTELFIELRNYIYPILTLLL